MLSGLTGFVVGWIKEFVFLGLALVEAFVLWIAYNRFMPISDRYFEISFTFPEHIYYWDTFFGIVLIHMVGIILGRFIQAITPKIVSISNESKSKG